MRLKADTRYQGAEDELSCITVKEVEKYYDTLKAELSFFKKHIEK